jgi:hypothetical protein
MSSISRNNLLPKLALALLSVAVAAGLCEIILRAIFCRSMPPPCSGNVPATLDVKPFRYDSGLQCFNDEPPRFDADSISSDAKPFGSGLEPF